MKLLVVDDDDIASAVAKKILENAHYEVELAEDGETALEVLRSKEIQIVITDWNMPNTDGIELCRHLRNSPKIGYVYIILVTSRSSKEDVVRGLESGADDFISKPFEPAELLARVRNAERVLALETTSLMLFSLAKLTESRDAETGNHLDRMREYTRLLAEQIISDSSFHEQVPTNFPELLYQTSPLHDIGKVGIPDHILLKPGSLNDEEWAVMKRHAEIGAETLDACLKQYPNAEYLRFARDIAWSHHERWDGTGYPRGLKADEIPFCARILALADVYDALTMKRVYKGAMSHEVARKIIVDGNGSQFDPQVVRAFLAIQDRFLMIREKNPDHKG